MDFIKKYRLYIISVIVLIVCGALIGILINALSNAEPSEPEPVAESLEFSPYYNNLRTEQKYLFNYICESASEYKNETAELPYSFEPEDLAIVCDSIRADRPDLFFLDYGSFELSHGKTRSFVKLAYTDSIDKISDMRTEYKSALENLIAQIPKDGNSFQKELAVNDLLCANCSRSNEKNILHNTAYGALVLKKAYCDGYSYAAKAMFNALKIDSCIVFGEANGENHMWNLVKTDEGYGHLDVMFNDADIEDSLQFHGFFNLNNEEIKKEHTVSSKYNFLPSADKAINYYDMQKCHIKTVKESQEAIYTQLRQALKNKKNYIELCCDETKETQKIAPYFESARGKLNTEFGIETVYEPFCIYEASKTNNAITIKIFTREDKG